MANGSDAWRVLENGGIEKLNDRLWRVQGRLPGMTLRRTMTVARRGDGGLVIHSAIALDEGAMREMEAWGTPRFLVVPNRFHRMDAPRFKRRYPDLRVLTPRGERAKVDKVVATDGVYEDFPPDEVVRLHTLPGTKEREGAMLVAGNDGLSVILNDVMMNMDRKRDVLGFLITTLMGSAPGPRISHLSKRMIIQDRRLLGQELERLASLPNLARLIVSHEKVVTGAAAAAQALRQAATYL
jgi:hypothetical protein